jgi:hypothetical protein
MLLSLGDEGRREEAEELFTGDEEIRRVPAMVRRQNSLAAARVGARRECGGSISGEGQLQDPLGRLL